MLKRQLFSCLFPKRFDYLDQNRSKMYVKDCMKQVIAISPATSILDAARLFSSKHIGSLPVVDEQGKLIGLLQIRDLLELVLPDFLKLLDDFDFISDFGALESRIPPRNILARSISTLMKPPLWVESDSGLLRAYALLYEHQLHDLPVVDENGKLIGIVSRVDVGAAYLSSWA